MTFGYLCEIAATTVIIGLVEEYSQSTSIRFPRRSRSLFGKKTIVTNEVLPGLYVCADVRAPSFYRLYLLWLPLIVYDGALCLLALWHAWISGYRVGRTDGACIQDGLVAGNASYFFWYAFVPTLGRVIPDVVALFRQLLTGMRRQHRHRTMSRGTSSPLHRADYVFDAPPDSMVGGGRRVPSGDGSDGGLSADPQPADVARSERGQETVRDHRVRRAVGRVAPPFEHGFSVSL